MTDLRTAAQMALDTLDWHIAADAWGHDIAGAAEALRAALAQPEPAAPTVVEPNPWREAVIDRLVVLWNLTGDNENDPRRALADIERMVEMMALDPCISSEAQALIDRGRAEATPPRAALTVDEAISALVTALAESKGWLRDYSESVIRDAIDRKEPRAARRMRSVTYVCPVCAASLERQE